MKLILCARGAVRSQTLAIILRDCYGENDIIVGGLNVTSKTLMSILGKLADEVWVVGDDMLALQATEFFGTNFKFIDVGDDIWGMPLHPALVEVLLERLKSLGYSDVSPTYGTTTAYKEAARRALKL